MYPYYFRTRIRVIRRPPEESNIHFKYPLRRAITSSPSSFDATEWGDAYKAQQGSFKEAQQLHSKYSIVGFRY